MSTLCITSQAGACVHVRTEPAEVTPRRSVWAMLTRWNTRRREMRHLNEMSDHHLNDIGIRRSEIRSIVYGEAMDHAHRLNLMRTY
jgi:uncharacterized protein YjiS (DUF1127 family)